jgi:hypothetical protein
MCTHHLDDGRLVCDRTTPHDEQAPGGHTYTATACPDLSRTEPADD